MKKFHSNGLLYHQVTVVTQASHSWLLYIFFFLEKCIEKREVIKECKFLNSSEIINSKVYAASASINGSNECFSYLYNNFRLYLLKLMHN
jgi:hypothetical protein